LRAAVIVQWARARPVMETMIEVITGVKVLSLRHDISTATGEEIVIFTLTEPPRVHETKSDRTL
jgi:uncharacterized protein YbcI